MRSGESAIRNHPTFRTFTADGTREIWGHIKFGSMSKTLAFVRENANTQLESSWRQSKWAGLGEQTVEDFYQSGRAAKPLELMQKAKAKLPSLRTNMAEPHAAITGGFWDTPSVIAGLPLAARQRKRIKLKPLDLRIAFVLSARISAEELAPITAKILRAIWDYIKAGGAVNLTVIDVGTFARYESMQGLAIETKVVTTDLAELSIALHPGFSRLIGGPLQTCLCGSTSIGVPHTNPIKGTYWIGGPMRQVIENAGKVLAALQISEA